MSEAEITAVDLIDDFEILTTGEPYGLTPMRYFLNMGSHDDAQRQYIITNHQSFDSWNDAYDAAFKG